MDTTALGHFLVYATQQGYAANNTREYIHEADGSTSIIVEQGEWRSHDNYFGGEPYGGRIVVSLEQKPIWMMVYYGRVEPGITELEPIYGVVMEALKQMPSEAPYRGPKGLVVGEYAYYNEWNGSIENYEGEEFIVHKGQKVYSAWYRGGLVNVLP